MVIVTSKDYKIEFRGMKFDYRLLMVFPLILLLASAGLLISKYSATGEWFERSIELRGGTLLNIKTADRISVSAIEEALSDDFGSISVRTLRGFGTQGASIQVGAEIDYTSVLDRLEERGIEVVDFSIENVGSSLSSVFWSQAQTGIIIAFIMMGLIAFAVFRTFVPSIAIIMAAASDIIITLSLMQVFGIEFSLASLGALLMLIGYSVDTDIMLTSRLLRETEHDMSMSEKINRALKTGLTMSLTSIGAMIAILVIPLPPVLVQIASVILIGLSVDIVVTWFFNSVILRWYCESRGVF
ncbi:MAG: protein translocase subunit SecF [Candidatus Aenigmatarchaeota archaeon]|nr:MAG: protein translocase subunit SecF [Candidatus Aenigmarchaeota archaeon]